VYIIYKYNPLNNDLFKVNQNAGFINAVINNKYFFLQLLKW